MSLDDVPREFLTDREVAARLKWAYETLRKKIQAGVFAEGVHFHKRSGCGRRWEWAAVVDWLRNKERTRERPPIRLASGGGRDLV